MVLGIQTLCCDTHIFNSGAVHSSDHPWDGSTPSFESSCVWLYWLDLIRKATHRLYKTLQLTVHVRAKWESWGQGTAWRSSETELWQGTDLTRLQKNSLLPLKVPKSTVASIILKWKTFGRPEPFLELAVRPNWAIGGEGLGERGKEEPKDHCGWAPRCIREMGESCRKSTITAALHQSGLYGRVARRKPLLSARHMKARMEFAKKHLKDSLVWWDQDRTFWP